MAIGIERFQGVLQQTNREDLMPEIKNGLIITGPGTCAGYVINFPGHGSFDPMHKVGDFTKAQIDEHNHLLAEAEIAHFKKIGRGVLYFSGQPGRFRISNFTNSYSWAVKKYRTSKHNFRDYSGRPLTRTDFWFDLDGEPWWGYNIGDSQIVHCRRLKR